MQTVSAKACHGLQTLMGLVAVCGSDRPLSHSNRIAAMQIIPALLNQQLVSKLQPWMQKRAFRWDIADLEAHACHVLKATLGPGKICGSDCPLSYSSNAKQNHFTLAQASASVSGYDRFISHRHIKSIDATQFVPALLKQQRVSKLHQGGRFLPGIQRDNADLDSQVCHGLHATTGCAAASKAVGLLSHKHLRNSNVNKFSQASQALLKTLDSRHTAGRVSCLAS